MVRPRLVEEGQPIAQYCEEPSSARDASDDQQVVVVVMDDSTVLSSSWAPHPLHSPSQNPPLRGAMSIRDADNPPSSSINHTNMAYPPPAPPPPPHSSWSSSSSSSPSSLGRAVQEGPHGKTGRRPPMRPQTNTSPASRAPHPTRIVIGQNVKEPAEYHPPSNPDTNYHHPPPPPHPARYQQQHHHYYNRNDGRPPEGHLNVRRDPLPSPHGYRVIIPENPHVSTHHPSTSAGPPPFVPPILATDLHHHSDHETRMEMDTIVFDHDNHHDHGHHHMMTEPPFPHHGPARHPTHFEVGVAASAADHHQAAVVVRMEGVEDHSIKAPLIVMDGANIAFAYAQAMSSISSTVGPGWGPPSKLVPDVRGLRVACQYFQLAELRVLIVLADSWYRRKPRPGDVGVDAQMMTEQWDILHQFKQQGLLVTSPPTDDDDSYVLTIARRENARAAARPGLHGPAFVLSNDLFRDAQERDLRQQPQHHQRHHHHSTPPPLSLRDWLTVGNSDEYGPGRISYAFVDMGRMDDHGDRELDIVPNPRHPLVAWIEQQHHHHHDTAMHSSYR